MKVTMLLADHAEAVQGKLYIMGGGWSQIGPEPSPKAIAIKIEVPWTEANRQHSLHLSLVDGHRQPIRVQTPVGVAPVEIQANFECGRPPGLLQGTPLDVTMAFNIGPVPLPPGSRYAWKLKINNQDNEAWEVWFSTRTRPTGPQPQQPQS